MAFRTGYRIHGRWPLGVALAVVLIGITGVLGYAAGPWPYAVGGGSVPDPTDPFDVNGNQFAFSALQGPSACRGGFGSSGHGRFDIPEAVVLGPVSCVSVSSNGNEAIFVVQNQKGTNTNLVTSLRVHVLDNGNPTDVPVDMIGWEINQTQCTVAAPPNNLVLKGNIVVSFAPGGC
jgi:hypothetical protein